MLYYDSATVLSFALLEIHVEILNFQVMLQATLWRMKEGFENFFLTQGKFKKKTVTLMSQIHDGSFM